MSAPKDPRNKSLVWMTNPKSFNRKDKQFQSERRMKCHNNAATIGNTIKHRQQSFAINSSFIEYSSAHWRRALSTERAADTTNALYGGI